jgi:hypothetical protein
MDITVTFQNAHWDTDPSPAIVAINTRVRWILRAPDLQTRTLLWRVHFRQRSPFGEAVRTLEATTRYNEIRQRREIDEEVLRSLDFLEDGVFAHRGATQSHVAERPGDYKYDLSVQDASTGEPIGDDDPMLYVVRGILRPRGFIVF